MTQGNNFNLPGLEYLEINSVYIKKFFHILTKTDFFGKLNSLKCLIFKNIEFNMKELKTLKKYIHKVKKTLTEVHLVNVYIDHRESQVLFSALMQANINCLNLSENNMNTEFIEKLVEYLEVNKHLRNLILKNCSLTKENLQLVFKALRINEKSETRFKTNSLYRQNTYKRVNTFEEKEEKEFNTLLGLDISGLRFNENYIVENIDSNYKATIHYSNKNFIPLKQNYLICLELQNINFSENKNSLYNFFLSLNSLPTLKISKCYPENFYLNLLQKITKKVNIKSLSIQKSLLNTTSIKDLISLLQNQKKLSEENISILDVSSTQLEDKTFALLIEVILSLKIKNIDFSDNFLSIKSISKFYHLVDKMNCLTNFLISDCFTSDFEEGVNRKVYSTVNSLSNQLSNLKDLKSTVSYDEKQEKLNTNRLKPVILLNREKFIDGYDVDFSCKKGCKKIGGLYLESEEDLILNETNESIKEENDNEFSDIQSTLKVDNTIFLTKQHSKIKVWDYYLQICLFTINISQDTTTKLKNLVGTSDSFLTYSDNQIKHFDLVKKDFSTTYYLEKDEKILHIESLEECLLIIKKSGELTFLNFNLKEIFSVENKTNNIQYTSCNCLNTEKDLYILLTSDNKVVSWKLNKKILIKKMENKEDNLEFSDNNKESFKIKRLPINSIIGDNLDISAISNKDFEFERLVSQREKQVQELKNIGDNKVKVINLKDGNQLNKIPGKKLNFELEPKTTTENDVSKISKKIQINSKAFKDIYGSSSEEEVAIKETTSKKLSTNDQEPIKKSESTVNNNEKSENPVNKQILSDEKVEEDIQYLGQRTSEGPDTQVFDNLETKDKEYIAYNELDNSNTNINILIKNIKENKDEIKEEEYIEINEKEQVESNSLISELFIIEAKGQEKFVNTLMLKSIFVVVGINKDKHNLWIYDFSERILLKHVEKAHNKEILVLKKVNDYCFLTSSVDKNVFLWQYAPTEKELVRSLICEDLTASDIIAFEPNLYFLQESNYLLFYEINPPEYHSEYPLHSGLIKDLVLLNDYEYFTCSDDKTLKKWEITRTSTTLYNKQESQKIKCTGTIEIFNKPTCLLKLDSKRLMIGSEGQGIKIVDSNLNVKTHLKFRENVFKMIKVSQDSICFRGDHQLFIINVTSLSFTAVLAGIPKGIDNSNVLCVMNWDLTGKFATMIGCNWASEIRGYDVGEMLRIETSKSPKEVKEKNLSYDSLESENLCMFVVQTEADIRSMIKFSTNYILIGDTQNAISILDLSCLVLVKKVCEHKHLVNNLLKLSDNLFLSSSNDETIKLWNIEEINSLHSIKINNSGEFLAKINKTSDLIVFTSSNSNLLLFKYFSFVKSDGTNCKEIVEVGFN